MGITRLKRKARRNKKTAATRKNSIKQLNASPVLKNIDKEAAKAAFGTPAAGSKVSKAERIEGTTTEVVEETVKTEEVVTPEASAEEVVSEEVGSVEEEAPEEGEKEG